MDARTIATTSPEGTREFGRDLARALRPGDIVLLTGDLGTGKTTFVQGIAEGLGAVAPATSPSFVIVNEYPLGSGMGHGAWSMGERHGEPSPRFLHPSPIVLRHIDLYRLPDPSVDLDRIGLPELLSDPDAITVVEWADRLPSGAPPSLRRRIFRVHLKHGEHEHARTIELKNGSP